MIGCKRGYVQAYLTEFCWRNAFRNDKEEILEAFLDALGRFGSNKVDSVNKFDEYFIDKDSDNWILADDGEIDENELNELLKEQDIPIEDLKKLNAFDEYRSSKNSASESDDETELNRAIETI